MAITRFRNSSILNRGPKYNDFLAGLPFRPIIGTATDGGTGTTVSVAFTGNNSAGAGVTYTALSSPGNITATGPASPITVSGLTAGTVYTFQVKAGNSLGDSAYSASSNSVTPVVPTSFESIATTSGNGSSSTITFSSIPSGYNHLQVRLIARGTRANNTEQLYIRLNGDTGTNYAFHRLEGDGANVNATAVTGDNVFYFTLIPAANETANIMCASVIDLLDYTNTNKTKVLRSLSGYNDNTSSTDGIVWFASGLWNNTSAVTSLSVISNGPFTTTTNVALYGIKGA